MEIRWLLISIFVIGILSYNHQVSATIPESGGNSLPDVKHVIVDDDILKPKNEIDLVGGFWKSVHCKAIVKDLEGYQDIINASAVFFDTTNSYNNDADDNNYHYTNSSCFLGHGKVLIRPVICTFSVQYYANPGNWMCNLTVYDSQQQEDSGNDDTNVNTLISLDIPATIDYGTLNVYETSSEITTPVTNSGNAEIDLTLDGYGYADGDGLAMNCTLGGTKNITLEYERYNVTASGVLWANMVNLTDSPVTQGNFNLAQKTNDVVNSTNGTYWKLNVPSGVEGDCKGHVVFTATISQ